MSYENYNNALATDALASWIGKISVGDLSVKKDRNPTVIHVSSMKFIALNG